MKVFPKASINVDKIFRWTFHFPTQRILKRRLIVCLIETFKARLSLIRQAHFLYKTRLELPDWNEQKFDFEILWTGDHQDWYFVREKWLHQIEWNLRSTFWKRNEMIKNGNICRLRCLFWKIKVWCEIEFNPIPVGCVSNWYLPAVFPLFAESKQILINFGTFPRLNLNRW